MRFLDRTVSYFAVAVHSVAVLVCLVMHADMQICMQIWYPAAGRYAA